MEESSGKPAVISRRSKYFSIVKSSYSLRKTPARSDSTPKPAANFSEPPKSLPRRYPSRVRVSAVQKKEEEEEEDSSGSRKRVKQTLRGFRAIYDKMMGGGEKEPGNTSRSDLVAYNLFKEKQKGWIDAGGRLGAVPGVDIGDNFNLRVEMLLVGLHCHLKSHIGYVTKDDRPVACSVVLTFPGHSDTSGDVLVCRGGGMGERDQRMVGGNLALKNSIDDRTPVRGILGFGYNGNRIKYVYAGLYLVEKYWSKKDHRKRKVFLFQLRRLEGQTKLKEVGESISSRTLIRSHDCFGKRGREEEEQSLAKEAESRKRVKQTLDEFTATYERLAREDEAKQKKVKMKKEAGKRQRLDLYAYNLCSDKKKDVSHVTRRFGAVPGVEVGDKFHFKAELCLLGLHCQLRGDIDYVRIDEKLLAVSVVLVRPGWYNTDAHKSDVLLFCDMKNRHTQMANGSLALKNSIDARTPVRVFYVFRKNSVTTLYVYFGLYLVEKHWRKKNDDGHYVCMFQLRRLPGQAKIEVKEAMESLSLRSKPEDMNCFGNGGREEEEQYLAKEAESRKRVKHTLNEFMVTYERLAEEYEAKQKKVKMKKETGKRPRFDLDAYNLCKDKKKDVSHVARRLGAVPGVEVGDTFQFRVELSLLGLHCQLRGDIDYIRKDQKLLAVSIVSLRLGPYNTDAHESDVLLFCDNGVKNGCQQMVNGNLALKNSIDAKTPVRVFYGLRKNSVTTLYTYYGLYLVEKHWRKKNDDGHYVCMFQLRRLPGQAKIEVKEAMELRLRSKPEHRHTEDINCFGKRGREEEEQYLAMEAESRMRVKQTLHEFIVTYKRLADEDEAKQKKVRKNETGKRSRFHLDAYNLCKVKNKDLSQVTSCLGAVPGVEVGDKFHFRAELALLGLHCRLRSDIDYVWKGKRLLAVSIVSVRLGQYNADAHKSDVLLFCASGLKNVHPQIVTESLALKNSIDAKTPVRVFYGFKKHNVITLYVYYGLYLVEKHWRKKNNDGRYVCMFQLRRLPGQDKIDVKEDMEVLSLRSKRLYRYTKDISRGKEKFPIRVVNTIDDERLLPFEYVTEVIYPSNYSPAPLEGCNCVNGCSDSDKCACAVRNGGEIPFNSNGAIVAAKPLVYECGPSCKCPPSCHNRVSQHGMKFPLEIFKTETMGWGVRCRTFIPSGSFICEYFGELLEDEEAQKRTTDVYLFAIGNNYYDESLWEGLSSVPCLQKSASGEAEEDGGFTADGSRYGNIAKFINHSCTPNLYAQNLLYDHDDKRMPHITFFACEDIPPLQELTYHYNYTVDEVQDSEGNIRKKNCYCGSIECSGRLY